MSEELLIVHLTGDINPFLRKWEELSYLYPFPGGREEVPVIIDDTEYKIDMLEARVKVLEEIIGIKSIEKEKQFLIKNATSGSFVARRYNRGE